MHRKVHRVHGIQRDPEGTDGALEHGGVGEVKLESLLLEQFARAARLLPAGFGQIDIGPARKTVFEIPLAFAVTHEDNFIHGRHRLKWWLNRHFIIVRSITLGGTSPPVLETLWNSCSTLIISC